MASEQRQCPRCKTWNARARNNCTQCGAVMLGVAAIDIDAIVRGDSAPLEHAHRATDDNDELRKTMEALRGARAARQAAGATQAGGGCAGCLGKLLLLVAIVVGGATIVAIDAKDTELGIKIRKVWHELEREFKAGKRRKVTVPPYIPPPPRPRPMPAPPDPWNVPVQPQKPNPNAGNAPLLAPDPADHRPLDERSKAIAKALDRRALLLLRCVQPETRPGEPRKVTTRATLRVHTDSGGAIDFEAVIEPTDAPAAALRCLRASARGVVVPNGDPVTFVYRWPKGAER